MCDHTGRIATMLAASVLVTGLALPQPASAQSGRIICWKDASGKVIGCGDKVPPEYQGAGTRELDSRGITRKQTESAEEARRRREQERTAAKVKTEEDRRSIEQKRLDAALLDTYSNEQEIDLKRDRDLQVLDGQLEQLQTALKNVTQRHNEARARAAALEKNKKPLPKTLKEELSRLGAEQQRFETSVAAKQKDKEELRARYAEYRKRYTELRAQQQAAAKK